MLCQMLIDRIIYNFPNEVMKTGAARAPDVHARPFANGGQPLEYLYIVRVVLPFGGW
ncbi:hypothetical protein D3C84_1295770 [compost metagenome]